MDKPTMPSNINMRTGDPFARPAPPHPSQDPNRTGLGFDGDTGGHRPKYQSTPRAVLAFLLVVFGLTSLIIALSARADVAFTAFNASGTNGTYVQNTAGYKTISVTVLAASGSPDGTVTVYVVPGGTDSVAKRVAVATYATPTTAKTYYGPATGAVVIELTGNSTGTVTVTGVLK